MSREKFMKKGSSANSLESDTSGIRSHARWSFSNEEKISYILLVCLLLLIVIIRSKFSGIPFERDEGIYSYFGKLLLEGKVPYIDFYEQKFPGIFYFYAVIVYFFGDTVQGMHQGFLIINLITVVFLFFASKRLFSPFAGLITAITFAIVSLTPNLSGFTVQAEHGVAFFISIGIFFYSFTLKNSRLIYLFLMGLAMGFAFMTKTSGMFLALWGGIAVVCDSFFGGADNRIKQLFIRGAVYSAGVFTVIGGFFLLMAIMGSFDDMFFFAYEVPKRYVNKIPWEQGKTYLDYTLKAITKEYKLFWVHAFLGLAVVFIKSIPVRIKIMAVTLLFFSCATVFPGYYFYGHYWIQIIPGLAIIAGLTFHIFGILLARFTSIKSPRPFYIYIGIFVIASLFHINRLKSYYFHPNYEKVMRNVYGSNPFPEAMEIGNYINNHSKPDDQIVLLGSEPQIYFYTKKKCPSRHAYFAAVVDNTPESPVWQKEFIRDVEKARPEFVVFFNHPISLFVQQGADQTIFSWFNEYVSKGYKLIGIVEMADGQQSVYTWNEALVNFSPRTQNLIYIYQKQGT